MLRTCAGAAAVALTLTADRRAGARTCARICACILTYQTNTGYWVGFGADYQELNVVFGQWWNAL